MTRRTADGADDATVRAQVMAEMRQGFLGDRLCQLSYASAPASPDVAAFIAECFQLPLISSYGMTEAGRSSRAAKHHALADSEIRLRDVPELGYFASDKPYPRGELCIRTATATPGYFRQPDLTAKPFDEEGFIKTGDVMEERAPDELVYIDRVNDVLKLSHGEFVAIGALGGVFEANCPAIHQIYVYGNSARSHLLAVIVPIARRSRASWARRRTTRRCEGWFAPISERR